MKTDMGGIHKKYGHIGSYIFADTNSYTVFGSEENNDLIICGNGKHPNRELWINGNSVQIDRTRLQELSEAVNSLTTSTAFATFLLTSSALGLIKETIKDLDATHLRIFNIKNVVKVLVFDYRTFLPNSLSKRENTQLIKYYETTNANIGSNFTFTIFSNSLLKLPNQDMNVRVGSNGICQFEPLKENIKFLFKDQEIIEPVSTCFSERLGCQISLSLAPNS